MVTIEPFLSTIRTKGKYERVKLQGIELHFHGEVILLGKLKEGNKKGKPKKTNKPPESAPGTA